MFEVQVRPEKLMTNYEPAEIKQKAVQQTTCSPQTFSLFGKISNPILAILISSSFSYLYDKVSLSVNK